MKVVVIGGTAARRSISTVLASDDKDEAAAEAAGSDTSVSLAEPMAGAAGAAGKAAVAEEQRLSAEAGAGAELVAAVLTWRRAAALQVELAPA